MIPDTPDILVSIATRPAPPAANRKETIQLRLPRGPEAHHPPLGPHHHGAARHVNHRLAGRTRRKVIDMRFAMVVWLEERMRFWLVKEP